MNRYYLIDIVNSRETGLHFYTEQMHSTTTDLQQAWQIPEAQLNQNLERYDNGTNCFCILVNCISNAPRLLNEYHSMNPQLTGEVA